MGYRVLAVGAHPDDIEFMMAGTLFLLGDAGCELHTASLADGCCGSMLLSPEDTARTRARESEAAAAVLGSTRHASIARDLELFYEDGLIRKAAALVREVDPDILLLPSPEDYMEDHEATARIMATAAFARGMPNYSSLPPRLPVGRELAVYHALPYGLRDAMGRRVRASRYVDIGPALERKSAMLACHESQGKWLDSTQGLGSYLETMVSMARDVGCASGVFLHAEGWRCRNELGFSKPGFDPMGELLGADLLDTELD